MPHLTLLNQLLISHHNVLELCQLKLGLWHIRRKISELILDHEAELFHLRAQFMVLLGQ